jgi:anti-sigma-K factor RskA
MKRQDLDELVLLYAAGTLDDAEERQAVEDWLASGEPEAQRALDEAHRLTLGLAATPEPLEPSERLWAKLDEATQDRALQMPSQPWVRPWHLAAAALLAAGLTLTIGYSVLRPQIDRLEEAELRVSAAKESAEANLAERNELGAELDALRIELGQRRVELAKARQELETAQGRVASLDQKIERLEQTLTQIRTRVDQSQLALQETRDRLQQREADLRLAADADAVVATLQGTDERPDAIGDAVFNRRADALRLAVQGLAATNDDQTYQAWALPVEGNPVPLGIFAVSDDGLGRITTDDVVELPAQLNAFAVSLEPAGGSESPTGPIVLVGPVRK